MTADGQYSYAFNGANEVKSAAGVTYTYDGDGLRVEKSSGTLYWRSYTGQVIEETNASGTMQRDYIFFAGRRIAWRDSSGNVYYYFADVVGSVRAVTNATGTTCFNADYYPYGQENDYNTSCTPTYKFAGYEYDSETGNYYAMARYYDPSLGRFLSADPLGGDVMNPQSLNRYTYVLNNPETFTDPLGLKKLPGCTIASGCVVQVFSGPLPTYPVLDMFGEGDLVGFTGISVGGPLTPIGIGHGFGGGGRGASHKLLANLPLAPPQSPGRVTQVAQCAANLANTMSVAHYGHLQNIPVASNIFSNDFSTVTNLIFGPNRAGAAGGLAENVGSGPALGLTAKGAGAVPVDSGLQFLFSSVPATTFGGTAIGGVLTKALGVAADVLSGEAEAQAIYDAGIYTGAVYVCSQQ